MFLFVFDCVVISSVNHAYPTALCMITDECVCLHIPECCVFLFICFSVCLCTVIL